MSYQRPSSQRGLGSSVAEWSDLDPGADQRIDRRYGATEQAIGPGTRQATRMIQNAKRRSAVTASNRYQWSSGGSAGRLFGRRQAAAADRNQNAEQQISDVETISKF